MKPSIVISRQPKSRSPIIGNDRCLFPWNSWMIAHFHVKTFPALCLNEYIFCNQSNEFTREWQCFTLWKPYLNLNKFYFYFLERNDNNIISSLIYVRTIQTYHSRFISEEVAEASQILPRDANALPKLLSYDLSAINHLVAFYDINTYIFIK
jgi:hypothetical protein